MAPPEYDGYAMSTAPTNDDSMDYEMEDASPAPTAADMGYEDVQPMARRGSMTQAEETQRRASIKAILADNSLPPIEKRRSIQHLMDGRRNSLSNTSSTHSGNCSVASSASGDNCPAYGDMGYGEEEDAPVAYCRVIHPHSDDQTKQKEQSRPPCTHYDRNCTMIAPCCGAAFGCRICHDDCPVLPPKMEAMTGRRYNRSSSLPSSFTSMGSLPEDNHHTIDRFAVKEVICRVCFTQQSSKT